MGYYEQHQTKMAEMPEYKWELHPFGKEIDVVFQAAERPCWWARLWMRILFGWKFEAIE